MKEPALVATMAVKEDDVAPALDDRAPHPATVEPSYQPSAIPRIQLDEGPSTSYDTADSNMTLLRKFSVHPTSSRRLQGLADVALMVLAVIPTAVFRLIRTAMGLLGITEHRWRGISMVMPLTLDDRKLLELTVRNLVAGQLGRRPEPPSRGPVPPAYQLLLDTHAILAAAASTAASFGLPYEGIPEAALHAKLASFLRSIASSNSVCTQDAFKAMRKLSRKTLVALCSAAPAMPAPPPPQPARRSTRTPVAAALAVLRSSPSAARIMAKPKPRTVAKAFMANCLMQQCALQAETLIQLVARLPDGSGDIVETVSVIPLAPGAEYLRLLGSGSGPVERFAEQLEAMAEYGRLRPSDAKTDPALQGMAINARVHSVGVVQQVVQDAVQGARTGQRRGVDGGVAAAAEEEEEDKEAGRRGAVAEGKTSPVGVLDRSGSGASTGDTDGWGLRGYGGAVGAPMQRRRRTNGADGGGDADGSEGGYGSPNDMEGLLKHVRQRNGHTSSQVDLAALNTNGTFHPNATAAAGLDGSPGPVVAANGNAANNVSSTTNGPISTTAVDGLSPNASGPAAPGISFLHRPLPPGFVAGSGPSTSYLQYPTVALDVFRSIYAVPRSGAFAVHGREPRGMGLSRLTHVYASSHAMPLPAQAALLAGLGFESLEQLREEVELRRALCVAQALPVVVASLRLMCRSAACLQAADRTGAFLHVQQGMLSDLHRHERGYLEDTKGALDVLAERLAVRFVAGSEKVLPLQLNGSSITVSLPYDCVCEDALSAAGLSREAFCGASYGLTSLLFNQGVNSLQSLGFLVWRGVEPLQDTINRHSLERLNEYAHRARRAGGPALAALNQHYSREGRRSPKDTAMFALVRHACSEVGAGRAVNCKSGKDRTALELSKALADEVVRAGLLPPSTSSWLEGQFLRGLSYVTTSQNHGQPPAYAFNEMELLTLPPGWRPDWRLCGKVSS